MAIQLLYKLYLYDILIINYLYVCYLLFGSKLVNIIELIYELVLFMSL